MKLAKALALLRLTTACLAFIALCLVPESARSESSERRVALLIGNDTYPILHASLANAASDAKDMGRALAAAGFETTVKTNVSRRELYQLIDAFGAKIAASPDTVGLFYYAGHGVQANGVNYLIPVDGAIESEADLQAEAVDVGKVLRAMNDAHSDVNIVILDACRDNPLPKGRSMSRGLAPMQAPRGTFIGYAAGPGQTALDGNEGGNGTFTGALVQQIRQTGVPIEAMFKQVIAGVEKSTSGRQVPWMESSLQADFYFTAPVTAAGTQSEPQPSPTADRDIVFWEAIKNSKDPDDFEDFLRRYPDSEFASIVRRRISALKEAAKMASLPPSARGAPTVNSASTSAPIPAVDAQEIARSLQTELLRVGCYAGAIDGVWGNGTANALRWFNQQTGKHLDTQVANLESVTAVRERADKVCTTVVSPIKRQRSEGLRRDDAEYQYTAPAPTPIMRAPQRQCFSILGIVLCQ